MGLWESVVKRVFVSQNISTDFAGKGDGCTLRAHVLSVFQASISNSGIPPVSSHIGGGSEVETPKES